MRYRTSRGSDQGDKKGIIPIFYPVYDPNNKKILKSLFRCDPAVRKHNRNGRTVIGPTRGGTDAAEVCQMRSAILLCTVAPSFADIRISIRYVVDGETTVPMRNKIRQPESVNRGLWSLLSELKGIRQH
jgi:hypothetical protein